jgi:hypothetical protein
MCYNIKKERETMNKNSSEVKNVVNYRGINVTFTEKNLLTGEVTEGRFKLLDGFEGRVYSSDKYTVVVLTDGSKGMAVCEEGEEFSFKRGLRIAFNKALIEHLRKETKKLYKLEK